jgi:uncharacterized protein YdhG (YjbR/CyaY superfamily)
MSPTKDTQKSPKSKTATNGKSNGFTSEERAAMKERVRESRRAKSADADGETDVQEKIGEMPEADRVIAEQFHKLIKANAPDLSPRTWYGMPAYTDGDKVVVHFQPAAKFKTRYATFGFSDKAHLDDGAMWPVGFALKKWTKDVEATIAALLKQATS